MYSVQQHETLGNRSISSASTLYFSRLPDEWRMCISFNCPTAEEPDAQYIPYANPPGQAVSAASSVLLWTPYLLKSSVFTQLLASEDQALLLHRNAFVGLDGFFELAHTCHTALNGE